MKGLAEIIGSHSKVFVLVDANTRKYCLPLIEYQIQPYELIEIGAGEEFKNVSTANHIWEQLIENKADRYSLLVNLGGGVVSDLGGFAAACFKRGIDFVNIPTTLLSMIDASIGGKTGIDFGGIKNSVGLFAKPLDVIVNTDFLKTLPQRQIVSGIAEMIKYGYVCNRSLLEVNSDNYQDYIEAARQCKMSVVGEDFHENGRRRILNFGHTVGHAFESYFNGNGCPVTHGEAVALGMQSALYLSVVKQGLPQNILDGYKLIYNSLFDLHKVSVEDAEVISDFVANDKKSSFGKVDFVLLKSICQPVSDNTVTRQELIESIMSINGL